MCISEKTKNNKVVVIKSHCWDWKYINKRTLFFLTRSWHNSARGWFVASFLWCTVLPFSMFFFLCNTNLMHYTMFTSRAIFVWFALARMVASYWLNYIFDGPIIFLQFSLEGRNFVCWIHAPFILPFLLLWPIHFRLLPFSFHYQLIGRILLYVERPCCSLVASTKH
jgi:hypothetical protein